MGCSKKSRLREVDNMERVCCSGKEIRPETTRLVFHFRKLEEEHMKPKANRF